MICGYQLRGAPWRHKHNEKSARNDREIPGRFTLSEDWHEATGSWFRDERPDASLDDFSHWLQQLKQQNNPTRGVYLDQWHVWRPTQRLHLIRRYTTHWRFWLSNPLPAPAAALDLHGALEAAARANDRGDLQADDEESGDQTCADDNGVHSKHSLLSTYGNLHSFITNSVVGAAADALNSVVLRLRS